MSLITGLSRYQKRSPLPPNNIDPQTNKQTNNNSNNKKNKNKTTADEKQQCEREG